MNTYDRIGKYKILSKFGEGGMETVCLGEHESLPFPERSGHQNDCYSTRVLEAYA